MKLVKSTCSHGVPLNDGWGCSYTLSPVFIAVQHGHVELVRWFLRRADTEAPSGALFCAISLRNPDMVKVLLQNGANVNAKGKGRWSALQQASYLGYNKILLILLKNGAEVDHLDEREFSGLMLAARANHAEVVSFLLKAGAQVNLKGHFGRSALFFAMDLLTNAQNSTVIQTLLDGGADVNLKDDNGTTPMLYAVGMVAFPFQLKVQLNVVKFLLEKKALIDDMNHHGDYALKKAVSAGDLHIAELLLKGGAKTDMKDRDGKSLLMAARGNYVHGYTALQITKLLLDYKVPMDIRDNVGRDALLYAVYSQTRDYEVIELLLENGANPCLKPDHGYDVKCCKGGLHQKY